MDHMLIDQEAKWSVILQLAYQSLGVVYGDIATSPLYVYSSTFTNGIKHNDDIIEVLSIIFYTITLIALVKYVFIVLQANDKGNGGTFALYSLICRSAKVGLIPGQEADYSDLSTSDLELPNDRTRRASRLKAKLENSKSSKLFLLLATLLGTSMVIGDSNTVSWLPAFQYCLPWGYKKCNSSHDRRKNRLDIGCYISSSVRGPTVRNGQSGLRFCTHYLSMVFIYIWYWLLQLGQIRSDRCKSH